MKRISVEERPALAEAAARHEFEFQEGIGIPFWDETNYYQFTEKQIDEDLVKPAEEIESLCFEVVTRAMEDETVFSAAGRCETILGLNRG
ncbi:MAG: glutathionylspermidine synthase family protein [Alphaproteobacteria bacterium]